MLELQKLHPDWNNLQLEEGAAELMGVDAAFIDSHRNRTHGDASDAVSRGREVEIAYNPTPHYAYLGAPLGRSGNESASIPGTIYRNVWIGSGPRPASLGSALLP